MNFDRWADLFNYSNRELQNQAARSVDIALVTRNWLFGWYIVEYEHGGVVEYEHGGEERSKLYGKALIARLSKELKVRGIKGISPTNLRKFREFYSAYSEIRQTLSVKSFLLETSSSQGERTNTSLTALIEHE